MRTRRYPLAWLLVLVFLFPGLAFAQRKARLIGKVLDDQGNPLQGVSVTATSPQIQDFKEQLTTDKKGIFVIDFKKIDVTYKYRFEKEGYQPLEAQQEWQLEGTQRYEWTMHMRTAEAIVEGAAPGSTSEPAVIAYNAGVAASKAKDYAKAEAKFKEAVGHDPNLRQAWGLLGVAQVELGKNQEAAEAAEKAVALGSTDEAVLLARWQAYRNLKDEAKAAEALKELEKFGRATEEAKRIHNEGVALVKAGDHAGAFAKFQEALDVDPNLKEALLGRATAGLKIGQNAEAATAAETILKEDPKNEKALRIRYNACLALGDPERMSDSLVGLAAIEPKVARDGLLKLAFDAYDAGDMAKAKERFLKVLAVDPNHPQAHYYLALITVGRGENAEAKTHLERFIELAPNDPEASSAREMLKLLSKQPAK